MKKIISILGLVLLIVIITGFVFLDKIALKTANFFLEDVNPAVSAKISALDINVSEAEATFKLSATVKKSGREFLKVRHISLDFDMLRFFDNWEAGLETEIDGVGLELGQDLLDALAELPETEKKDEAIDIPFIFLQSLVTKNIDVTTLNDPNLALFLSEIQYINSDDEQTASISRMVGTYTSNEETLRVLNLERAQANKSADEKDFSVEITKPSFKISQSFLDSLKSLPRMPLKEAQTEAEKNESKNRPVTVSVVEVMDSELNLVDANIFGSVERMKINLRKGEGEINNLSAQIQRSYQKFFKVKRVGVGFNPEVIYGSADPKTTLSVNDVDIKITPDLLKKAKLLPKGHESPEESKSEGTDPSAMLSYMKVKDVKVHLTEQDIKGSVDSVIIDMKQGKIDLSGISSALVDHTKKFLMVEKISADFDPEELGNPGKPVVDVSVLDLHLTASKELIGRFKSKKKQQKAKDISLPVKISRILIGESSVSYKDFPGVGEQEHLTINGIFGSLENLTMEPGTPLGKFKFNATFEGDSKIITFGQFDLSSGSPQFSANWKLLGFDLLKINDELRKRVPVTYTEGTVNAFGEAVTRDGAIVGYVKPFLKDASYIGNEKDHKGIKHFFVEAFATFTNWLLEHDRRDSVATRVPFVIKDGKIETDTSTAAWRAIEHGLLESNTVDRGIDHKFELRQAEEERPD